MQHHNRGARSVSARPVMQFLIRFAFLLAVGASLFAGGSTETRQSGSRTASSAESAATGTVRPDGFPRTVIDDLGERVAIPAKPMRIVSGTLMADEILLSLLPTGAVAAVTNFAQDPEISNVAELAVRVPHASALNVELYLSLEPDLVVLAHWSDAAAIAALRGAGVPVYRIGAPSTFEEVRRSITGLAAAIGEETGAEALIARMDGILADVKARTASLAPDERLTVMDYSTWGTAMGRSSSWDEIVTGAGLVNAAGTLAADEWGSVPVSKELLLELDPDILVLPGWVYGDPSGADTHLASVLNDPALKGMTAIRTGKVIRIPEAHRSSTSHFMALAVEDLARAAYPELFR
jgi:iron complex transport system substrate-binding protein